MENIYNYKDITVKVSQSPLLWDTLNHTLKKKDGIQLFIHLLTHLFTEFVLKFGKLLSRGVKCLVQGHTTSLQQSQTQFEISCFLVHCLLDSFFFLFFFFTEVTSVSTLDLENRTPSLSKKRKIHHHSRSGQILALSTPGKVGSQMKTEFRKVSPWDFPGGRVVNGLCSRCRGCGFEPCLGN